jgi:DNA-binding transcriptional LysR family regulator
MSMIYLLVGVPASGKSWVAERLKDRFIYVPHDEHIERDYLGVIAHTARSASQPVLCETPFSVSAFTLALSGCGFTVVPVFIIENESVLKARWVSRNTPETAQKGHLTRQKTFLARAEALSSYMGTSAQVFEYLKHLKHLKQG